MAFWAWGRDLEDLFDQTNHVNLRSVLHQSEGETVKPVVLSPGNQIEGFRKNEVSSSNHPANQESSPQLDYLPSSQIMLRGKGEVDSSRAMPRIPIAAIYYRNDSAAKGVPHSFVTFVRRYPVLPQIVVCRHRSS